MLTASSTLAVIVTETVCKYKCEAPIIEGLRAEPPARPKTKPPEAENFKFSGNQLRGFGVTGPPPNAISYT